MIESGATVPVTVKTVWSTVTSVGGFVIVTIGTAGFAGTPITMFTPGMRGIVFGSQLKLADCAVPIGAVALEVNGPAFTTAR